MTRTLTATTFQGATLSGGVADMNIQTGQDVTWARATQNRSQAPVLNASLNVTSVTDNGNYDNTLNFTVAYTSANYGHCGYGSHSFGAGHINSTQASYVTSGSFRAVGFADDGSALSTAIGAVGGMAHIMQGGSFV